MRLWLSHSLVELGYYIVSLGLCVRYPGSIGKTRRFVGDTVAAGAAARLQYTIQENIRKEKE